MNARLQPEPSGVGFLNAELRARNAHSLQVWKERRAARIHCLDAYPDAWRKHLTAWFHLRLEYAHRWMFKNRCEVRALRKRVYSWQNDSTPAFLRKQAD